MSICLICKKQTLAYLYIKIKEDGRDGVMQYLVKTCGDVASRQSKAYVVNAKSKEQAQEVAKANFYEEFDVINNDIYTKPQDRMLNVILAYIFMAVSIGLSFVGWTKGTGHDTISISPNLISCLYAVFIYAAYVVRFKLKQRTVGSIIDILFCVFMVLLLSSFIQGLFQQKEFCILGLKTFTINTNVFLFVVILLV